MELLQDLNPSQRDAVEYIDGPSLIIAGAGSGKTRVLTYKVAYLLSRGVNASNILCLTFTNKAAREMKERIQQLVPPELSRYLWMGTFHSIAARILRHEAEKMGFTRDFSIYDTSDTKAVLKSICKDLQLDEKIYKPSILMSKISAAKTHLETADQYALSQQHMRDDRYERLYQMSDVYREYEKRLRLDNAMDFDDLLMNLCLLLRHDAETRELYQQAFQYILVDEYQDTNLVQYQLVRILGEPQNKVFVVGDDAQSIYSFRGADIRNILTFQQGYSKARLFKLERNYRSTQMIVNAANSLIHHNENQIYKDVYSENAEGERLGLITYMSDRDEATGVAEKIKRLGGGYDDIAILYRTNAQSRAFENELRRLNIPYRIYGGTSFYQRKEIKDAIGYFRVVANPKDTEALMRIINFPARGIGNVTLNKISQAAQQQGCAILDVVADPVGHGVELNSGIQSRLHAFIDLLIVFHEAMDTMNAFDFAKLVLERSNILGEAATDTTPEGVDRKQNLDELLSGIREFVDQRTQEGIDFTPITDFLAEVSLLTDQDDNQKDHTSRVTLMTVHAAKGLEFKYVFVVGLEEGLFPSAFSTSSHEIEEERRLLYVAITRAMERCWLTLARQRFRNGQVQFSAPSSFLKDIDRQYIQQLDSSAPAPKIPTWPSRSSWGDSKLKPVGQSSDNAKTPITNSEFAAGDRVEHRVFGKGTVQQVYRENDNDKVDILFDGAGKKVLMLAYAKLEKI